MIKNYEKLENSNTTKRISVLLDSKTFDALNKLMEKKHLKISDVVRLAIMHFFKQEMESKSDLKDIEEFRQYLEDGSHIVLDIETLLSILGDKDDSVSDKLWETIEKDGYRHGIYYKSIGVKSIEEVLKQKEIKNWFKLRFEADNCYYLALSAPEIQKFLKHFLKGLSEGMGVQLEIKEIGARKLLVKKI